MSRLSRFVVLLTFVGALVAGATLLRAPTARAAADERARAKFEVYKDRAGEFRWRLKAQNTQVLATSGDGYKTKRDCMSGIESVKRAAAEAPVEDVSEAAGAAPGEGAGQRPAEPPQTGRRGNR
jgi:uncharacterized protein YegP (UPF0339 family)